MKEEENVVITTEETFCEKCGKIKTRKTFKNGVFSCLAEIKCDCDWKPLTKPPKEPPCTCKYCGRPCYGFCCPSCWDDFEAEGCYGEEKEEYEEEEE